VGFTVAFVINDTDFNFDDGSEGLLSQLQEEESRPYCNFYCFLVVMRYDFWSCKTKTFFFLFGKEDIPLHHAILIHVLSMQFFFKIFLLLPTCDCVFL